MPKSRVRKKKEDLYTPPPTPASTRRKQSPRWLGPLIVTLWLLGVAYLVTSYISDNSLPVMSELGNGNILIGFGLVAVGFALATQWR